MAESAVVSNCLNGSILDVHWTFTCTAARGMRHLVGKQGRNPMLRFAIAFLCGLSLAAPLAAQSDDQPIVVEGRSQKKRIDSFVSELTAAPGPVAAWQVVDDVGTDGMPLGQARMGGDSTPVRTVNTIGSPSRLKSLIRRTFLGSIVVVEAKALNGVSTRQLADYAAMRTLAPTDTRRQVTLPAESILTLLDAGKAPGDAAPSVTWWDYAFLKSLYATSNDVAAAAQRDQMKRVVGKVLKDVPKEED